MTSVRRSASWTFVWNMCCRLHAVYVLAIRLPRHAPQTMEKSVPRRKRPFQNHVFYCCAISKYVPRSNGFLFCCYFTCMGAWLIMVGHLTRSGDNKCSREDETITHEKTWAWRDTSMCFCSVFYFSFRPIKQIVHTSLCSKACNIWLTNGSCRTLLYLEASWLEHRTANNENKNRQEETAGDGRACHWG